MNIPDHISESLETIFGLKYLNSLIRIRDPEIFLSLDPGWKKFGSGINIPDPQHWCYIPVPCYRRWWKILCCQGRLYFGTNNLDFVKPLAIWNSCLWFLTYSFQILYKVPVAYHMVVAVIKDLCCTVSVLYHTFMQSWCCFKNIFWAQCLIPLSTKFFLCTVLRVYSKLPRLWPSDSTVSADSGIEPRTVAMFSLSVRRSRQSARFYPLSSARSHPHLSCLIHNSARSYLICF